MKRHTRKHIIETARKLFSEHGYLGVSMNDIAGKLNISKAALYYHFKSKTEIYKNVLDEVFSKLSIKINEAFEENIPGKKLLLLIQKYLDFGNKERNLIKMLAVKITPADPRIKKYIIRLRNQISNLMESAIKDARKGDNLFYKSDSHSLASILTNTMDGILLEYSFLNKRIKSKEISAQIFDMLFPKVEA